MNRKMRRAAATGRNRQPAAQPTERGPDFLGDFLSHGWQLLAEGRDEQAMELAARAVRLRETDESKAFFVQCVKRWSYFPEAEKLTDVLARALREAWGKTSDLIGFTRGLLDHDAVIGPATRRAFDAWPRRLPLSELLDRQSLATIAGDPLLLALLESSKFAGVELERFLTSVRAGLLDMTMADERHIGADILRFACAIARQCFITEYIFDLSAVERERIGALREKINHAIGSGDKISPFELAVLAAYESVDSLAGRDLLLRLTWPGPVDGLLDQQICEPAAERRHRDSIPKLTPINDDTSVQVREQYEDNPYPRWLSMPAAGPSVSVDEMMAHVFSPGNYRPTGKTDSVDLLIAGCGTGHDPILFARGLRGAKTLALDLSLSSLCYAKQKTLAMGLDAIEYAQADILELGSLGRSFDVISVIGVLHHLADPEQGWRTLLSLLRRDGCMHVGLYSKTARRNLIDAHAWLAARGYTASVEDIRRARQDLAAAAANEPKFSDVLSYADFYTMSECRDLLFHRQDHEFDIPRIHAFLAGNGLQFLGFQVDDTVRDRFWRRYSRDREADLMLWQQFEIENPDTFKGMYQFYVQKG